MVLQSCRLSHFETYMQSDTMVLEVLPNIWLESLSGPLYDVCEQRGL